MSRYDTSLGAIRRRDKTWRRDHAALVDGLTADGRLYLYPASSQPARDRAALIDMIDRLNVDERSAAVWRLLFAIKDGTATAQQRQAFEAIARMLADGGLLQAGGAA